MNDLDKLNEIEHLMKYFSEGARNRSLNKMAGKIKDKIFKDLCEEHYICNVCGKELDKDGRLRIWDRSQTNLTKDVKATTCPGLNCEHNENLAYRLQQEENFKGVLHT